MIGLLAVFGVRTLFASEPKGDDVCSYQFLAEEAQVQRLVLRDI